MLHRDIQIFHMFLIIIYIYHINMSSFKDKEFKTTEGGYYEEGFYYNPDGSKLSELL
jgi:hypothetical protein